MRGHGSVKRVKKKKIGKAIKSRQTREKEVPEEGESASPPYLGGKKEI